MKRSERGFTMVEVLVAVLLTAIAMTGMLGLYAAGTRAAGGSRHVSEATVLAQDEIERLRTSALIGNGSETNVDHAGKAGGIFTRSWEATPAIDYTELRVTVSWNDEGVARQVTLRSRRNN